MGEIFILVFLLSQEICIFHAIIKIIPYPHYKSSKSDGWNFKPDRKGGSCLSRLVEEIFWERWGFGVLLKLQCVGSHKLCLCTGPALRAAFCQNSHLLVLEEVATHSVHLLLLVCSKWLLAQTWDHVQERRKHTQGTVGKLS